MNHKQGGFTLLEMIVALALVGIVTFYVTDMLVRQNRAYTVVDEVTGAQQNLRAIADLLEREARVTGFMVPEGASFCGYDNANAPDIVFFTDADAINPANQTQQGMVADVTGFPGNTLTLNVPGTGQGVVLDTVPFYDNNSDGVADSDFMSNPARGSQGGVIVFDRSNPGVGTSCGIITNVNAAGTQITVDWNMSVGVGALAANLVGAPTFIPAAGDLVAVPAHWYAIVPPAQTGSTAPQLWRDGMLLADDVEDLQFAAFYDLNGNGVADAGEYPGSGGGEPFYVSNSPGFGDVGDNTELRELRMNFVVRTSNQDPEQVILPGTAQGVFQALENRVAPAGPPDGFRRRVHTMAVQPRNIGKRN